MLSQHNLLQPDLAQLILAVLMIPLLVHALFVDPLYRTPSLNVRTSYSFVEFANILSLQVSLPLAKAKPIVKNSVAAVLNSTVAHLVLSTRHTSIVSPTRLFRLFIHRTFHALLATATILVPLILPMALACPFLVQATDTTEQAVLNVIGSQLDLGERYRDCKLVAIWSLGGLAFVSGHYLINQDHKFSLSLGGIKSSLESSILPL